MGSYKTKHDGNLTRKPVCFKRVSLLYCNPEHHSWSAEVSQTVCSLSTVTIIIWDLTWERSWDSSPCTFFADQGSRCTEQTQWSNFCDKEKQLRTLHDLTLNNYFKTLLSWRKSCLKFTSLKMSAVIEKRLNIWPQVSFLIFVHSGKISTFGVCC